MQQTGVGDKAHACSLCSVDDSFMLRLTLAHFTARDQQQLIHACKSGLQRLWLAIIGLADNHAQRSKIGRFGGRTHSGNNFCRRNFFQ